MEFLGMTFCSPRPLLGTLSHFTDVHNWVPQLLSGGAGI